MNRKKNLLIICLLLIFGVNAQTENPKDFGLPVDIPILLAGNFGELRPNHFHAGIDIKTPNGEGEKLYSIADGVVSRIKVSTRGYGKVIYIIHPNGYTSVYAHLQKFSPEIEAYVKKNQYLEQKFEVDLFPTASELKVKKGQLIGLSGNTGGSMGPHLHFEIRDSKTQKALNPQLFGYQMKDRIPPQVYSVYGYSLSENAVINGSQLPHNVYLSKQADGSFLANKIYAIGKIGFGVQTIDKMDFTNNTYGVYKASMVVNGSVLTSYTFDELDFSEDHYINTFIDYSLYSQNYSRVQLMYKKPSNKLSIYKVLEDNGMIDIEEGLTYMVSIVLEDMNKNVTKILIPVEGKKQEIKQKFPEKKGKLLVASRENLYKADNATIFVPEEAFYEDIYMDIRKEGDTLKISPTDAPLRKAYSITFDLEGVTDNLQGLLIASVHPKTKKLSYQGAVRKGKTISVRTKTLGNFVLTRDTVAPKITPINFSKSYNKVKKLHNLKVKIEDNFSGIARYEAYINGKWILMEHEPKEKLLTFDMSDIQPIKDKNLNFKLQVFDNVGNQSTMEIPLVYE